MRILLVTVGKPTFVRAVKLRRALLQRGHLVRNFWLPLRYGSWSVRGILQALRIMLRSLEAALRIRGYDVIHMIEGWDIGLLPLLLNPTPKVFDVRIHWARMIGKFRSGLRYRVGSWIARQIMKMLVRHCDHVTVVDPYFARRILRMRPRRWSYLRNFPEAGLFRGARESPPRRGRGVVFGYIGVISPQRNVHNMLRAWHRFVKRHPECRMRIIGITKGNLAFFKQVVKPLLSGVEFSGRIPYEEIPRFYQSIDVMVVPNRGDHYPLKLGEAMAAGVPIIARDGVMRRKLVGDKGVVYFKGDEYDDEVEVEALERAFETALRNIDRLREEASSKDFPSWEGEVARLERIYMRLVKGRR